MDSKTKRYFYALMDKYLSNTLSEQEQQALSSLLQDRAYIDLFNAYSKDFAITKIPLFELDKIDNFETRIQPFIQKKKKTSKLYLLRVASVAASIILALLVGMYVNNKYTAYQHANMQTTVEVPIGSRIKTILPDGSEVWLNSGSRLSYNPTLFLSNRKINLSGEGYFNVRKDQKHPFRIHTDDIGVEVLGTSFNFKAYPHTDIIDIGLISGSIKVTGACLSEDKILKPNDRFLYNRQTHRYELIPKSNTSRLALWTTGKVSFVNASLPDILQDIERKYNVTIAIESSMLQKEFFTGSISLDLSLNEVLEYLDVDRKYEWTQHGSIVTIKDKQFN